ncbi:MAG: hypothetical protein MUF87_21895, partial [Anaerolineae bacterium]|nr:hypothetical protein [Anaerolineae bacterium]
MADNQFQVQPQSGSTTGDATSILTQLKEALIGGEAVQDFFAGNLFALNNLYQTIATSGDEVWLDIDVNGDENTPGLVVQNGNNAILVSGQLNDTDTLQNGTGDSTNFKVVGAVSVTLGTTQGDSIVMVHDIMYA